MPEPFDYAEARSHAEGLLAQYADAACVPDSVGLARTLLSALDELEERTMLAAGHKDAATRRAHEAMRERDYYDAETVLTREQMLTAWCHARTRTVERERDQALRERDALKERCDKLGGGVDLLGVLDLYLRERDEARSERDAALVALNMEKDEIVRLRKIMDRERGERNALWREVADLRDEKYAREARAALRGEEAPDA